MLNWKAPLLALPPFPRKVVGAQELIQGSKLQVAQSENGVVIPLLPAEKGQTDRVVVLTLAK